MKVCAVIIKLLPVNVVSDILGDHSAIGRTKQNVVFTNISRKVKHLSCVCNLFLKSTVRRYTFFLYFVIFENRVLIKAFQYFISGTVTCVIFRFAFLFMRTFLYREVKCISHFY